MIDIFGTLNGVDLVALLEADELYQELMKTLTKEDGEQIKQLVIQYMKDLQGGFVDPLADIAKTEEFQKQFNSFADDANKSEK